MTSRKFKHMVIAIAGPPPEGLTVDKVRHWTEVRKGRFTQDFDEDVTHLLLKDGLKRKRVKIVDFDWFELSAGPGKVEKVAKYCYRRLLQRERALRRDREQVERGNLLAARFVNTNLFRVHYDNCNFRYEVSLVRGNHLESGQHERYVLYLFESNAKPPLFWFAAKYFRRKGDSQPAYFRPSHYSGPFDDELRHFKGFFQAKTGIEWEDRVTHYGVMPASFFTYTPPRHGKPIGRDTLFSAKMSWELNAALRGIPDPSMEEPAEEVQEGLGGAVLEADGAAVVVKDALLGNADLEKPERDDGSDWSLVDLQEHDGDVEV
ncbi:hypothetical protein E4U42_004419 [Claviceps africana]|uniref:WGR domain-containing protein n=1 Tax=Claviceps africana TaxID=83212 RepID=A0A8K0NI42_9HYPO|nr:hypothetical protein E4U42_004419 [Claviceps africana]